MKDHSPIKRHPAIVTLSKDHHFGLLLAWKIRQGLKISIDAERISNYVLYFFSEDLEKHFKEEEQFLFCMLPVSDTLRRRAESEHQSIYNLVAAIKEDKQDPALLGQFADELEKHIRFEERDLFNYLQREMKEEDLEAVANHLSGNNKEKSSRWKDAFWNEKIEP